MNKLNRTMLLFLSAMLLVISGCGSDSSMKDTTDAPGATVGESTLDRPYVTDVDDDADTSKPAVTGYDNIRLSVEFSAAMDPSTITSSNITLRDITGTIVTIPSTVTYDPVARTAYVYYTIQDATPVTLELIVSRNVRDINGTGLGGHSMINGAYNYTYATVNADYRICSSSGFNTTYDPLYVTSMTATPTSTTTASVDLRLSRNVLKSSLPSSVITVSGGTLGTAVYNNNPADTLEYANRITIPVTGLTANSVYSVTFNPSGVTVYAPQNLYPDGTTAVFTETDINFMDSHAHRYYGGNPTDRRSSDFVVNFSTDYGTPADVVRVNDVNDTGTQTVTVEFTDAIDPATVIAANVVAYNVSLDPVQVKVRPIYSLTIPSEVLEIEISTSELGGEAIQYIMISNGVHSAGGLPIDGNGDGSLLDGVDFTGDGVVDDDNYRSWGVII